MKTLYDNIPLDMRELPNWVCFRLEQREGKTTKMPYSPNGRKAKSNDKTTWANFEVAKAAAETGKFDGIGFMFGGSGYVGVDIDHCITDGKISAFATEVITTLNSYTEISPSGTGLHIILKGRKPKGTNKNSSKRLEIYDTGRYFTITGNLYDDKLNKACKRQFELNEICKKYLPSSRPQERMPTKAGFAPLSDEQIIERIVSGNGGGKSSGRSQQLQAFWHGNYQLYTDDLSAADQSLCNALAFWTQRDAVQMDRIFRRSGIYQLEGRAQKWNQKHFADGRTYGQATIQKAIVGTTVVYSPRNITGRFANEPKVQKNFPVLNLEGEPIKEHWRNTEFLLERWGIILRENEITHRLDCFRNDIKSAISSIDNFATSLRSHAHESGLKLGRQDVYDHIGLIASKNKYNPFADYLEDCYQKWDKKEVYFTKLLTALHIDTNRKEEQDFIFNCLKKWLIQAVKLAYNKGEIKPAGILVMQGTQGIGKSSFVKWLLKDIPELVATELAIDPTDKDSIMRATSVAIAEISEMGRSIKDRDAMKQFFSKEIDRYRPPYGRAPLDYPRKTSFIGTVNDATFLLDDTGERRYWVLPLIEIKWDVLKNLPRKQLWGEIYKYAIIEDQVFYLSKEEITFINSLNERYHKMNEIEQTITDILLWDSHERYWLQKTPTELCVALFGDSARSSRVGRTLAAMAKMGKIKEMQFNKHSKSRKYLLPPLPHELKVPPHMRK